MAAAFTPGRLPQRAVTAQYSRRRGQKAQDVPAGGAQQHAGSPPEAGEHRQAREAQQQIRRHGHACPGGPPRAPRAANTAKVCRVKGTVRGTVIQAHTGGQAR